MKRKLLRGLLVVLAVAIVALYASAPPTLINEAPTPQIEGDLAAWVAQREFQASAAEALGEIDLLVRGLVSNLAGATER